MYRIISCVIPIIIPVISPWSGTINTLMNAQMEAIKLNAVITVKSVTGKTIFLKTVL